MTGTGAPSPPPWRGGRRPASRTAGMHDDVGDARPPRRRSRPGTRARLSSLATWRPFTVDRQGLAPPARIICGPRKALRWNAPAGAEPSRRRSHRTCERSLPRERRVSAALPQFAQPASRPVRQTCTVRVNARRPGLGDAALASHLRIIRDQLLPLARWRRRARPAPPCRRPKARFSLASRQVRMAPLACSTLAQNFWTSAAQAARYFSRASGACVAGGRRAGLCGVVLLRDGGETRATRQRQRDAYGSASSCLCSPYLVAVGVISSSNDTPLPEHGTRVPLRQPVVIDAARERPKRSEGRLRRPSRNHAASSLRRLLQSFDAHRGRLMRSWQ